MGFSFTNLQIKTEGNVVDINRVLDVLTDGKNLRKAEAGEEGDVIVAVHPGESSGWATVVSDLFDQDDGETIAFAYRLSRALRRAVIAVSCFDSDYLFMNLVDLRTRANAWASCGRCPGKAPRKSNFAAWKDYVTDTDAFRSAMRGSYVCAEDCLREAEPFLALPAEQSMQAVGTAAEEAGFVFYRYMLAENEKAADPPRFTLGPTIPVYYSFGNPNIVGFLNCGGPSKGVAVFIGGEPFQAHQAEIERVELQFHDPKGAWVLLPVEMREKEFNQDVKGYYGVCPDLRIPKAIPEELPLQKRMRLAAERVLIVRFHLRRGYRQDAPCGCVQVSLIPLAYPAGQTGAVLSLTRYADRY